MTEKLSILLDVEFDLSAYDPEVDGDIEDVIRGVTAILIENNSTEFTAVKLSEVYYGDTPRFLENTWID